VTPVPGIAAPPGTPRATTQRLLRVAFWTATTAAMVVTHWPKLRAGPVDSPIDKLAHASAYAALMGLACVAHPATPRWIPAALLAVLGVLDELGQAIPAVGRSAELDDWLADVAGILVAWAFVSAAAPAAGNGVAALLDRRRSAAAAMLLARPINCMNLLTAAAVGALAGAPLAVFVDSLYVRKGPQPWQYGFVGAMLGAAVASHALWEAGVRWRIRRAELDRPCIACGAAQPDGVPDGSPCAACGAARSPNDWAPIGMLPGNLELRACAGPILLALAGLVVASTGSIAIVGALRLHVESVESFDQWYRSRPADFRLLADLTLVALLGAWALRQCRSRIGAALDRCGDECLSCGYDLRASAPGAGQGTCHECGAPFLRAGARAPGAGPPDAPAA
jgi:VanZ family protein